MVKITAEIIREIAVLAKLELTADELKNLTVDLADIVKYVEKLEELELDGVPETAHALDLNLVFREDKAEKWLTREEALMNAPAQKNGYFSVPKVIEKSK
ncbi:MAG: Asp-tRNA(Asn)/Glu-tRNA(Gln) amidotransferase subunit GatC [Deferribacteres bacterium]|nr:Asp-tRNA(Asn)/Glu-tRNA(Gln) amidotransferase subunit GatC [candidate division KSB1 bacterium]MCB9511340.1 Asp-tRNA(Asn)/Glu-tRNA(Gln) amidotransferase subunit GatC [Deferribacteres bacterium]